MKQTDKFREKISTWIIMAIAVVFAVAGIIVIANLYAVDDDFTNPDSENMETVNEKHIPSDEIPKFIDKVYSKCNSEMLPMSLQTNEIPLDDMDMVEYHTGFTDITGIDGIYLSESMMGSVAYSMIYISIQDDTSGKALLDMLMDSVNPAKWICVSAEKESGLLIGNDIIFVMGQPDTVDMVIGEITNEAGARNMAISENTEKINPV